MPHAPFVVTSDFGPRRSGFHTGVDFGTPVGTLIGAPYSGVADVRKLVYSYGWHIWIRDGVDEYLAAHLSKLLVEDGEEVHAGEKIGETGGDGSPGSGNSTGPHLHYEWRRGGTAQNPIDRLGSLFHPGVTPETEDDVKLIRIGGGATVYACLWGFKVAVPSMEALAAMGASLKDVAGVGPYHVLAKLPEIRSAEVLKHLADTTLHKG